MSQRKRPMKPMAFRRSAVQPLAHAFPHLEKRYLLLGNFPLAPVRGLRPVRALRPNRERPEAAKLDTVALFESAADLIQNGGNEFFDVTVIQSGILAASLAMSSERVTAPPTVIIGKNDC